MAGAPLHILPLVDRVWRLDAQRFREGQRPALIPPRCVFKLALDCARPLQRTAGSLRLGLALGDELRAIAALPDALDEAARRQLTASARIRHLLRQPAATPVRWELEVALAVPRQQQARGPLRCRV